MWPGDPVPWIEQHFHTAVPTGLIVLEPVQRAVLRYMFQPPTDIADSRMFRFRDLHYSTIKKSGKTAIAGAVGEWSAGDEETWGRYGEAYCCANDLEQAQGRIYGAIRTSIEQRPEYPAGESEWQTGDRRIRNIRTGTTILPVGGDWKGAAGGNPTLTLWTELWAYTSEGSRRLWDEMKPSPVRANSMRFVETYRGFKGESRLLEEREKVAMRGRQVTAGELVSTVGMSHSPFEESPHADDLVPLWINEAAGLCAYIDEGDIARRMPWQQGERGRRYYQQEEQNDRSGDFDRHHRNMWAESVTNAIPIEWWDACLDPVPLLEGDTSPIVVAIDAGVSHDAFAFQAVSRHPDPALRADHVVQRASMMWVPKEGETFDFGDANDPKPDSPRGFLRAFCAAHNVKQVAYDRYELHDFAVQERKRGYAWFREFPQGADRLVADRSLYDLIRDRRLHQLGDDDTREHVRNCAAKVPKDDDSRMRFIKKSPEQLIDLAVALSMASSECLRLLLG